MPRVPNGRSLEYQQKVIQRQKLLTYVKKVNGQPFEIICHGLKNGFKDLAEATKKIREYLDIPYHQPMKIISRREVN